MGHGLHLSPIHSNAPPPPCFNTKLRDCHPQATPITETALQVQLHRASTPNPFITCDHHYNVTATSSCESTSKRDPRNFQHNKLTVLINGFSESRIPILQSIAATYSLSPLVSSVLVLWGNPSTSPRVINQLALNLSSSSESISLKRNPSSSLNDRFLPRLNDIHTDAVLVCDDDIEVDGASFEFAFRVWSANRNRIVGLFARSHDLDLNRKEWLYTVHPDRYSIVLTKFMLLKSDYLYREEERRSE